MSWRLGYKQILGSQWTTGNRLLSVWLNSNFSDLFVISFWFHWFSGDFLVIATMAATAAAQQVKTCFKTFKYLPPTIYNTLFNHQNTKSRKMYLHIVHRRVMSQNMCKRSTLLKKSYSQAKLPLRKITSKRRDVDVDKLEVGGHKKWSGMKKYKKKVGGPKKWSGIKEAIIYKKVSRNNSYLL